MARITFRLPEQLHGNITARASANGWSLNDELIYLVRQGLKQQAQEDRSVQSLGYVDARPQGGVSVRANLREGETSPVQ